MGNEAHVWQDGCGIGPAVAAWPLPTRADASGRASFLDRRAPKERVVDKGGDGLPGIPGGCPARAVRLRDG